jgi:hypothetical protein
MPIKLDVRTPRTALSTHDSLHVHVSLHNDSDTGLELPNLYDTTSALTFELLSPDGEVLRRMNGLTQQYMLSTGRIDGSPTLDDLQPGETWSRTFDMAPLHYLLPAGNLSFRVRYEYEPAAVQLVSGPTPLRVSDPPIAAIHWVRDRCMLDGISVLIHSMEAGVPVSFLRYYSYSRPLAAWHSAPILQGESYSDSFCSTADFAQAESFDPAFERFVAWSRDNQVSAQFFISGQPSGAQRRAPLPDGCKLLPFACHDHRRRLTLFLEAPQRRLECFEFHESSLLPVFSRQLSAHPVAVRADEESFHLLLADRGLVYERIRRDGYSLESRQLFRSRLPLYSADIEPFSGVVRALFLEPPPGKSVHLFAATLATRNTIDKRIDHLPLRGDIGELDFDLDVQGRFHMLVATTHGRLYYLGPNLGPSLIATGRQRFFPRLCAQRKIYIGYSSPGNGFRFYQFDRRRRGTKIVPFEGSL